MADRQVFHLITAWLYYSLFRRLVDRLVEKLRSLTIARSAAQFLFSIPTHLPPRTGGVGLGRLLQLMPFDNAVGLQPHGIA